MYQGLLHLHNLGRWIVIILLLIAISKSLIGMNSKNGFNSTDRKTGLFLMISAHIMLLIGLYQWFAGPWGLNNIKNLGMKTVMTDSVYRFWAVEHLAGMMIGIVLITIGRAVSKKKISDKVKHTRSFWYYLVALIVILISVPWPFREVARPMFPGMN